MKIIMNITKGKVFIDEWGWANSGNIKVLNRLIVKNIANWIICLFYSYLLIYYCSLVSEHFIVKSLNSFQKQIKGFLNKQTSQLTKTNIFNKN